jgi:hypothetical protein
MHDAPLAMFIMTLHNALIRRDSKVRCIETMLELLALVDQCAHIKEDELSFAKSEKILGM